MRTLALTLLLCAAAAGAQSPQTPTPTPTLDLPVAPKARSSGGGEFRVGGFMISGDRSLDFSNNVSNATGSIQGLDVVLRARFIGVQVKSLTGTFESQPNVTSADARLLLFPPAFTIMIGSGRRALWSELNPESPTQFEYFTAGLSSTIVIGGSGLRTNFNASMYQPAGKSKDKIDSGMEGEASIIYRLPKVPFYLQAGYRTEVFTAKAGTRTTPEEVRGIKAGAGMVFGGR